MEVTPEIKKTYVYQYAKQVLSEKGKNVRFGKWVKLAAKRFMDDLKRDDIYLDVAEINKVTMFFEEIVNVPELRKSVKMPLPHAFWIQQMYGWKYKKNDIRRFKEAIVLVARKNWKTFYGAGISIYELLLGHDKFPQIIHGANSREQALICTQMAGAIINSSPELKDLLEDQQLRIFTEKSMPIQINMKMEDRSGWLKAIPRELGDGGNPSAFVIDEFHEAKDTRLIETLKSGQGARVEPINIIISSPGYNKAGPLYSTFREAAVKMLLGVIEDDRNLALLFEQDSEEDWDNPKMIEKANPVLPYSPTLEDYWKDRIKEAKNKGGQIMTNVKIKNSGVWVDAAAVWVPDEDIKANNHGTKLDSLYGHPVDIGIDMSKAKDLTAISYLIDGDKLWVNYHIPEAKLDDNSDGVDYRKWAQEGWVTVHEGNVIDHDVVSAKEIEFMKNFEVKGIGFDNKYAYQGIITSVAKAGYEDLCMPIQQGFGLSEAVLEMEIGLSKHKYELFDNPITRWNFSNVVMKVGDQGHRFPTKAQGSNKIDGVVAGLTAITRKNQRESEPEKQMGILILN